MSAGERRNANNNVVRVADRKWSPEVHTKIFVPPINVSRTGAKIFEGTHAPGRRPESYRSRCSCIKCTRIEVDSSIFYYEKKKNKFFLICRAGFRVKVTITKKNVARLWFYQKCNGFHAFGSSFCVTFV